MPTASPTHALWPLVVSTSRIWCGLENFGPPCLPCILQPHNYRRAKVCSQLSGLPARAHMAVAALPIICLTYMFRYQGAFGCLAVGWGGGTCRVFLRVEIDGGFSNRGACFVEEELAERRNIRVQPCPSNLQTGGGCRGSPRQWPRACQFG